MTDLEYFVIRWAQLLKDAEWVLPHEQSAGSRAILRERIANYKKWIAWAEAKMERKGAA